MTDSDVLQHLPYKSTFRFVDEIVQLDENGVTGLYKLRPDSFFYDDHFPGNPITPGVILTEIMAQIGLVVLGIYLVGREKKERGGTIDADAFPLLSETNVSFSKIVLPGETVRVLSQKEYFRFGKLKCKVEMRNEKNELVARGHFAGMMGVGHKKIE